MADLDLKKAASPRDVVRVLRAAANEFYVSAGELESAWQEKNAGAVWDRIGRDFESLAEKIEKRERKHGTL